MLCWQGQEEVKLLLLCVLTISMLLRDVVFGLLCVHVAPGTSKLCCCCEHVSTLFGYDCVGSQLFVAHMILLPCGAVRR